MADLVLRGIKGSPLSIEELDTNFININNDIGTRLTSSSYTATDVLAKILTVDGSGSGIDADLVDGYNASTITLPNTLAVRNTSGNLFATTFIGNLTGNVSATTVTSTTISAVTSVTSASFIGNLAGNVTGNLTGNVNGDVTGDVTGNITGDVTGDLTGSVVLTGTLTANSSVGTSGQVLKSRGTGLSPEWGEAAPGTSLTGTANQVLVNATSGTATTGSVTLTLPQSINTAASIQFGSIGIGTAASGTTGEIRATNEITAYYSDERLKTRLGIIENALDKVDSLSGFYYQANQIAQDLGYKVRREVGVSAQEVQAVMPEIVSPAPIDEQYLTVHYDRLTPLLIEAIKELRREVKQLKDIVNK